MVEGVGVPKDVSVKRTSKLVGVPENSWQKSGVTGFPAKSDTPMRAVSDGVMFTKPSYSWIQAPCAAGLRAVRRISFVPPEAKENVGCRAVEVLSNAAPVASS